MKYLIAAAFVLGTALLDTSQSFAQGGRSGVSAAPALRVALTDFVSGSYADTSRSELKNTSASQNGVRLGGSEVQIAGSYNAFETELQLRSITPKATPAWSKRSETLLREAYYYPAFPWVQPVVGYFQVQESGDQSVASAPPAFITHNTGLSFGLNTEFSPYNFGQHGFLLLGRMDYLTSLEKSRNFGTDRQLGVGYYYISTGWRFALDLGQERNYFNATRADPADANYLLHVRHIYQLNRLALTFVH